MGARGHRKAPAPRRGARAIVSLGVGVLVAGFGVAAAFAGGAAADQAELERQVRARGLDPSQLVFPGRLTEEMRRWVHAQVRRGGPEEDRAAVLLERLLAPSGLDFDYDPAANATAQEVFETGRGNCLAFAQLFISMAREIGVSAYYLHVEEVERFQREEDLILISGHITAGYRHGPQQRALEFSVGGPVNYRFARPIDDLSALALYYSNRGAESLRRGLADEALPWLETAVTLDPALGGPWVNLGVVRRRLGDLDGAEEAYRRAIEADTEHLSAYYNLAILLRMRGERDVARQVLQLLDRRGNRNPYTYLALGDASLRIGELAEAERYYRRAVRLGAGLAEPRAAMGNWALRAGDPRRARVWLERAQRVDPDEERTARLREGLSALTQEG